MTQNSDLEPALLALFQEAIIIHDEGRYQEAEELFRRVIATQPNTSEAHSYLGNTLRWQGRNLEAEICQRQAILLKPNFAIAHFHLAEILSKQGRYAEAEASFQRAGLLKPDFAKAHYELGILLQGQERLEEAKTSFQRAIQTYPEFIEAHRSLGSVLLALDALEEAEQIFRKAVALDPLVCQSHNNLGKALFAQRRFEDATLCFQQAIACNTASAQAHNGLGAALIELGDLDAAEVSCSQALVSDPDYAEAHNNLALIWLLRGDYQRGWPELEWRWNTAELSAHIPIFVQPRWDGSSLQGKTIFLWSEQGFGDILQCIRFIPLVRALGARVLFHCYEPLMRLLTDLPGIDQLIHEESTYLPAFDVQLSLLSLPNALQVTLETIPQDIPYLKVPAPLGINESLQQKLQQSGFKVGLVWAPKMEVPLLRKRYCPLDKFAPLFDLPSFCFFSLYKGSQIFELEPYAEKLVDIGSHCKDFADTAWVVAQLDLVITVDTAVAHLAGAIGKETWVLLPFSPDWRWLLDREDSPWYPTMRLFRQPSLGNWESVITHVSRALQEKLGS
jgi:tetratricopeptide (TPR) repeat protein